MKFTRELISCKIHKMIDSLEYDFENCMVKLSFLFLLLAGLSRYSDVVGAGERGQAGFAGLREGGGGFLDELPASLAGLRREPLWPARRCHVRFHVDVRRRERVSGRRAEGSQAADGPRRRQPA